MGMRRALSLRIHVLFNLRCLMKPTQKKYILRDTHRRQGEQGFPSLFSTLYRVRKVSKSWYFDFSQKLRSRKCFSRTSLLAIVYITIILEKDTWEGGKGASRFRLSPRFVSVKSYVVSWVASQDGFSRILEPRFQKVIAGLRLLLSS